MDIALVKGLVVKLNENINTEGHVGTGFIQTLAELNQVVGYDPSTRLNESGLPQANGLGSVGAASPYVKKPTDLDI